MRSAAQCKRGSQALGFQEAAKRPNALYALSTLAREFLGSGKVVGLDNRRSEGGIGGSLEAGGVRAIVGGRDTCNDANEHAPTIQRDSGTGYP